MKKKLEKLNRKKAFFQFVTVNSMQVMNNLKFMSLLIQNLRMFQFSEPIKLENQNSNVNPIMTTVFYNAPPPPPFRHFFTDVEVMYMPKELELKYLHSTRKPQNM